jgi:SAM-dependent methyltransferase
MLELKNKLHSLKYLLGIYPNFWQLPNAVKLYEFMELTRDFYPAKNTRVLDLGCGKGIQTQLLAARGADVFGVDPSTKRFNAANGELKWSKAKRKVRFFCGTLEEAKLKDKSFDSVISFCVLEHIPNLPEVLQEIHRILKDGGELHATVDALDNIDDAALKDKHRNEHAVVQYFTPETIEETLRKAGFRVTEKRHILTSDLAKDKLIEELTTGKYFLPPSERKKALERLKKEEEKSASRKRGTMILCRAQKV